MKRQKVGRTPARLHSENLSLPAPASATQQAEAMRSGDGPALAAASSPWRQTTAAAGLIILVALAAYGNSFDGAFIWDDGTSIVGNQTIRQLWPIGPVLVPPRHGETVSGRPLLNLSLAINYAISGLNVWSYHVVNLLIHIAAALLLFGILRRTFLMPALGKRFGKAATAVALAGALIWMVHPLQTESVTYIVQRAESLAGLFYLLTLYCVIRGAEAGAGTVPFFAAGNPTLPTTVSGEKGDSPPRRCSWPWHAAAVCACLLGMACKEVLVTAPLLVLLYDRSFLAGSFAGALRRRWGLYVGLAATWGLLAYLVFSSGLIFRQSELGAPHAWDYARTQPGVILHYLRLSVWPRPLCFDCDWPVAGSFGEIFPGAMAVGLILAATIWGLIARKPWSFLGAWFLLILAPTSSIFPLAEMAYEHRCYLPLAAVVALAVAAGYAFCDRLLPRPVEPGYRGAVARWAAPLAVWAAVLAALGYATAARNSDYRRSLAFWQDMLEKRPDSFLAHYCLGSELAHLRQTDKAIEHYQAALRLRPQSSGTHYNLANLLAAAGRTDEAVEHYRQALRGKPDYAEAHQNLALALAASGKTDEALEHCREAVRLRPKYHEAQNNLANALVLAGHANEAIEHYQQALQLKPDYPEAHQNLGTILSALGRTDEAIEHYRQALRGKPDSAKARNSLARLLTAVGRIDEASEHYQQLLQRLPDSVEALNNLAWLLATHEPAEGGDPDRAIQLAQRARELTGQENAQCLDTLAAAYAAAGRFADAVATAEKAVQLADAAGQTTLASRILVRLELYRAGRPYREPPARSGP